MKSPQAIALIATALILARPAAHADALRAAIFPFELDDTSLQGAMQGAQAAETARLAHLRAQLTTLLSKSGEYQPVDIAPVAEAARKTNLRTCDGCAVDLARELGAQVSVIGWVQKVSNLILNINVVIRDVASGKMTHAGSVDIRGDTDESWSRGLAYLVRNRILAGPETAR
ncbi:MAG TPA: DUF3280 domain-containing protein [Acetobacteraceae bacterium]